MTAIESARDRLSEAVDHWSGRPTLVAIALMNVITGLAMGAGIAGANFGVDSGLYRQCAVLLAQGQTEFCGFLYSPLMALAAWPLTWVSATAAGLIMSFIGGAILLAGVALETRGRALVDRVLIGIAVFTFAPVVYELLLGQTTLLIAATLYPIARRQDGFRNGIPFGVALALAPKPLLVPVLVWMLVWRRKALTATILTAAILTGIGVAALGFDQYRSWFMVLTGAGRESVSGTFVLSGDAVGNRSLWPLNPVTFVVACAVVVVTGCGNRPGRCSWIRRVTLRRAAARSLLAALRLLDPVARREARHWSSHLAPWVHSRSPRIWPGTLPPPSSSGAWSGSADVCRSEARGSAAC